MKKYDVISIGSSLRDIFILNKDLSCKPNQVCHPFDPSTLGDKISVKKIYFDIGGGGSNTAATFGNLGFKVALFSQVGDDLAGKEIFKVLKNSHVDTSLIEIDKKLETGYSVIFIDKDGDRTALVFRGASDFNHIKNISIQKFKPEWLFVTTLNGNLTLLKKIFAHAKKNRTRVAWNPGNKELEHGHKKLKTMLFQADIVFLNLNEAKNLVGTKTENIKTIFSKLKSISEKTIWCVTGGKKGAWVEEGENLIHAGIIDKKVVNATGAGDAFGSGFVSGVMLYRGDLIKALQLAMLNSNSVVTKMGAKHGLLKKKPTNKQLNTIKTKII